MPELAAIKTPHFECVIWTKDISASQQRLSQTMLSRHKQTPGSTICFRPGITILDNNEITDSYKFKQAIFFENKQYDIEFIFDETLKEQFTSNPPRIIHRLRSIEEAFHYSSRSHSLRATINTGNDIGWFRIELLYQLGKQQHKQAIAFEVLPTKIDMDTDVNHMNTAIDAQYPLWRFTLAEKTEQKFSSVKKPDSQFLLLWLAQFERLHKDFERGLKHIVNAPHSRLISVKKSIKPEKLRGKLSPKLELAIAHSQLNGTTNKRYSVKKKQLCIDTPENRFIKSVINISIDKIFIISRLAQENQYAPDAQRLSDSFFQQLDNWKRSLRYFQHHTMFQDVGKFTGLSKESLVLQQKAGYAKVYRVWQELKWYLDLLGDEASLSLRNVAELYEVWCFLEVRNILIDLGFNETDNKKSKLTSNGLKVSMEDGFKGAFSFERDDGVCLRLAHEPIFRGNTKPIKSWTTPQKPDILLKATFSDNTEFLWLFDAKYRIKPDAEQDMVPEDAINQLHRYRDALIHQHKSTSDIFEKTRPVFGAYALYPGFYNQNFDINPYQEAIEEIGIGAFSLLPGDEHDGNHWLRQFLEQKLGSRQTVYSIPDTDRYYVEESVRIPYKGTTTTRYSDLTIAVNGIVSGRSETYRRNLEQGKAQHYHMKLLASERQSIEQHVIKEARYLAIAVKENASTQVINFLYPILGVIQKKRGELTEQHTGTKSFTDPSEIYWLFKLGKALQLNIPVEKSFSRRFEVKLTSAAAFSETTNWTDLPVRYPMLNTIPT